MRIMLLAVGVLAIATAARADVIELRSGQRVEGVFKGADDTSVRIERAGRVLTFRPEQVRAIYYGPVSAPTAAAKPAGAEALEVLKALQAVTVAGPSYTQYLGRVVYAQFRIEEQLELPELSDPALRSAVNSSMDFYEGASRIWQAVQQAEAGGGSTRQQAEEVKVEIRHYQGDCPALVHLQAPGVRPDEVIAGGVPAAWSCAADKIAQVEAIVAEERK